MKFKGNDNRRELKFMDRDGDKLSVMRFGGSNVYLQVNARETVSMSRKKARKLAKSILKETEH